MSVSMLRSYVCMMALVLNCGNPLLWSQDAEVGYGVPENMLTPLTGAGAESDGRRVGLWTFTDREGRLVAQGFYRDNLRSGSWLLYHEHAPGRVLWRVANYDKGILNGSLLNFSDNGSLSRVAIAREGRVQNVVMFSPAGWPMGYYSALDEQGRVHGIAVVAGLTQGQRAVSRGFIYEHGEQQREATPEEVQEALRGAGLSMEWKLPADWAETVRGGGVPPKPPPAP